MSIRIGILGYGNLGRGVECAIKHNPDMELVAVFTRRDPASVKILTDSAAVYHVDEAEKMKDKIDVMILCGGSATDLPVQTPKYAQWFNVVDSFDTHARVPEHFANVEALVKKFALKFLDDPSFGQLKTALADKDAETAFRAAHTLKGICINLGFSDLYRTSYDITEIFRGGTMDGAEELMDAMEAQYQMIVEAVTQVREEESV